MSFKAVKSAVGTRHISKSGFEFEVIEDLGKGLRRIKFLDEFGWETVVDSANVTSGSCGNLYGRTIQGVGYFGEGPHDSLNNPKAYQLWYGMFARCYSEKALLQKPSYGDKFVGKQWHNFQDFANWCDAEHGFGVEGWELDKDILFPRNKEYGPDKCCFVPGDLNIAFCGTAKRRKKDNLPLGIYFEDVTSKYVAVGRNNGKQFKIGRYKTLIDAILAYKGHKEAYMKILAEKYKGVVSNKVYLAVLNYKEVSGEEYVL